MAQAALLSDLLPRQISFKYSLQLWRGCYRQGFDVAAMEAALVMMGRKKIGNRPGRIEPRAVKRRPKAYPLLTMPRAQAREELRKNGHLKKLK